MSSIVLPRRLFHGGGRAVRDRDAGRIPRRSIARDRKWRCTAASCNSICASCSESKVDVITIGNSMAIPVMRWIGKRIAEVEAIFNDERNANNG